MRLYQLFFKNFLTLFFVTLFLYLFISYFILKKIEISNFEFSLKNMIEIFELNLPNITHLNHSVKKIKKKTGIRVTIIDIDGVVLAESNKDISKMQNHKDRKEIVLAKRYGYGSSIRYSHTLKSEFMYVAKKVEIKDKKLYIRMAISLDKIMSDFYTLWIEIVLIFVFFMLIALLIAYRVNQNIAKDIIKIKDSLQALLNKKYNLSTDGIQIVEFRSILKQIQLVSQKLQKRKKQKDKYTKKLKLLTKRQSDIISAIGHEFKNPITTIIGYANSLEDQDLDPSLKKRFLKKITNNAYKMSDMIDRLSMSIKFENKSFKPSFSEFDLKELLEDIKETLLQKYKNRKIIIDVKEVKIYADKTMIENLFINLIENALKYSTKEVLISLENGVIKVIDYGIGIDKKHLNKITKKFYTDSKLTWNNSIGVGLYIVEYILKLHDIKLKIKSEVGVGSEFSFEIEKLFL